MIIFATWTTIDELQRYVRRQRRVVCLPTFYVVVFSSVIIIRPSLQKVGAVVRYHPATSVRLKRRNLITK